MLHKGNTHSKMRLWHNHQRTHQVEEANTLFNGLRSPDAPVRELPRLRGPDPSLAPASVTVALSPEGGDVCVCWAHWLLLHEQYCSQRTAVFLETNKKRGFGTARVGRDDSVSGGGGDRTRVVLMRNRSRLNRGERSESAHHIPL